MKKDSPFYGFSEAYSAFYAASYDFTTSLTGYSRAPRRLAQEFAGATKAGQPVHKVLDFGCGTGRLTQHLNKELPGLEITGLDPNKEMLKRYHEKFDGNKIVEGGYDNGLSLADGEYDAIAASGVFDHLAIDTAMMKEFLRAVKPGGVLAFTYERHKDQSVTGKEISGGGRTFRSYADAHVRRSIEEAGGVVERQKADRFGYFVNLNNGLPRHIKFGIMIARK